MDAMPIGSQADACCSSTVCKLAGTALVAIAGIMCHVGACLYNGNAMPLLICAPPPRAAPHPRLHPTHTHTNKEHGKGRVACVYRRPQ